MIFPARLAVSRVGEFDARHGHLVPLRVARLGLALSEEDLGVCGALGGVAGCVLPGYGKELGHGGNTAGLWTELLAIAVARESSVGR